MGRIINRELMEIGENIRRLRLIKGYQQESLAEALDVSGMTVCRIENGTTTMNILLLKRIAKVLDVPVQDILETDNRLSK